MLLAAIKQIKFCAWQFICFRLPNKTSSFKQLRRIYGLQENEKQKALNNSIHGLLDANIIPLHTLWNRRLLPMHQ